MQAMLNINSEYSIKHKYEIHPAKSTVTILHQPKSNPNTEETWTLAGNSVPIEAQFTHLGLEWKAGRARPNITKCVSSARRTAYSLLGAGLHGRNGLDPITSMRIITLYVVPRLLHGLESTVRASYRSLGTIRYILTFFRYTICIVKRIVQCFVN